MVSSVHGDDFATAVPKSSLDWFKSGLEKRYEFKEGTRFGPASGDYKEGRVLNRIVRWGRECCIKLTRDSLKS